MIELTIKCAASYGPFSSRADAEKCEHALRKEADGVFYVNDVAGKQTAGLSWYNANY